MSLRVQKETFLKRSQKDLFYLLVIVHIAIRNLQQVRRSAEAQLPMNDTTAQSADQTTSSCLSNPSQFASKRPKNSPKHQAQKFLQVCFLQRVGSAVLSAGQILAQLLCLEVFYFFAHVGRCFPHPGAWELPVHNPSALICPTHIIPPLLSHQSRQREGSVLGSGSAVTHSSCPGDDGHTDPS